MTRLLQEAARAFARVAKNPDSRALANACLLGNLDPRVRRRAARALAADFLNSDADVGPWVLAALLGGDPAVIEALLPLLPRVATEVWRGLPVILDR